MFTFWPQSPFASRAPVFRGPRSALWLTLLVACGAPCRAQAPASASVQVQAPVPSAEASLSLAAERRLGDRIVRSVYQDPDYLDDPVVADYLQSVWQPLRAAARQRGDLLPDMDAAFAWQLLQVRDRSVNAFALPGGYLGVHLGLLAVVANKDELASVLAHELSHVTQRHIARLLERQSGQAPWLVGAMVLAALAASKNPAGANAVIVGGQAVAAQVQLNFSRDMEREADRAGWYVATDAGFAAQGFVSMFEKLQLSSRNNDAGQFPYLRSHPLTTERIADMQSRLPEGVQPVLTTSLEHGMVAARARLLATTSVDSVRSAYAEAAPALALRHTRAQRAAALYGAAYAAIRLREWDKAAAWLDALEAVVVGDVAAQRLWRLLSAESASAQDQPARGLRVLGAAAAPRSRAELMAWIPLKVAVAEPGAAADAAQLWLADHPDDASLWQLLASARAAQGRTVAAVRAEAEAYRCLLDYAGAVTRLKAAQTLAAADPQKADYMESAIVDARLRQLEPLAREQAVER